MDDAERDLEAINRQINQAHARRERRMEREARQAQGPVPGPKAATPPFKVLGCLRGPVRFVFFTVESGLVHVFNAHGLSGVAGLTSLAPLAWWQEAYPLAPGSGGGASFAAATAADALMRACFAAGIYNPAKTRGRGVWKDGGKRVAHLGNRLVVDGVEQQLGELESGYLYERAAALGLDPKTKPATDEEASGLVKLCGAISFAVPDRDARLFAGWLAMAFIAGAAAWRPHVWLTSEAGAGKTWIIEHIAVALLGELCVYAASKSTEPGVRRVLANDALAFLYDESEGDSQRAVDRLSDFLELLRQASSDSSAELLQAVSGSSAEIARYRPNFPGLLGSINVSLTQSADESRFMVMPMRQSTAEEFVAVEALEAKVLTKGFGARLFWRMYGLVDVVEHNARLLSGAIATFGSRRAGDTLGWTLAGWLALQHGDRLDEAGAVALVQRYGWLREAAVEQVPVADWRRMLLALGQQRVRVPANNTTREITVAEAMGFLAGRRPGPDLDELGEGPAALGRGDVRRTLAQAGILLEQDNERVLLSRESQQIARWLGGVVPGWAHAWKNTLLRASGAERAGVKKVAGQAERCIAIPLPVVLGEAESWEQAPAAEPPEVIL